MNILILRLAFPVNCSIQPPDNIDVFASRILAHLCPFQHHKRTEAIWTIQICMNIQTVRLRPIHAKYQQHNRNRRMSHKTKIDAFSFDDIFHIFYAKNVLPIIIVSPKFLLRSIHCPAGPIIFYSQYF